MKLLRDPLTHFVVTAALIFALHAWWQGRTAGADSTIVITQTEVERLAALYAAEAGTLPTEAELAGILTDHVRDEALAREARRLGLDEGDTIVTRRLAQKMTFMVADLNEDQTPSEQELEAWHAAHPDRFTDPARITFSHVYFSTSDRRDTAEADAEEVRDALNTGLATDASRLGDPFMLQRQYGEIPYREITRLFGGEFAQALSALPASDDWQGPVWSALGVHLVRISSQTPARLKPFEEARADVLADWQDTRRREANEAAIADIVSRYKVIVEGGK